MIREKFWCRACLDTSQARYLVRSRLLAPAGSCWLSPVGDRIFLHFEHDPQRHAMTIEVLEGFPVHRTTSVGGLMTRAPVSRPLADQPLLAPAGSCWLPPLWVSVPSRSKYTVHCPKYEANGTLNYRAQSLIDSRVYRCICKALCIHSKLIKPLVEIWSGTLTDGL